MKFRFYLIDSEEGTATGTNDQAVANAHAATDVVIDSEEGTVVFVNDFKSHEIVEQTTYQL